MEEFNEDEELTSVVRHHNRTLRKVNKALRTAHRLTQEYNDSLFTELCDSSTEAERALRRLWEEGGLESLCSPEDYDTIVNTAIKALELYYGG